MYSDDERPWAHHRMAVPVKDLVLENYTADFRRGVRGAPDDVVKSYDSVAAASRNLGKLPLCMLHRGR